MLPFVPKNLSRWLCRRITDEQREDSPPRGKNEVLLTARILRSRCNQEKDREREREGEPEGLKFRDNWGSEVAGGQAESARPTVDSDDDALLLKHSVGAARYPNSGERKRERMKERGTERAVGSKQERKLDFLPRDRYTKTPAL